MSEAGPVEAKTEKSAGSHQKAPVEIVSAESAFFETVVGLNRAPRSGLSSVLPLVGSARRGQMVHGMQRLHGNAFVSRFLAPKTSAEAGATPAKTEATDLAGSVSASRPDPVADAPTSVGTGPAFGENSKEPPAFPVVADNETLNAGQVKWGRHADFPAVLGQTYYEHNKIEMWPSFKTKLERSFMPPFRLMARVLKTDAAGASWPALATPESESGYAMPNGHPKHPGYELFIRESGTAANIIAGAEQQHINDLDTGWDITGIAARDAINAVAGEDPVEGEDAVAAKKAAVDKTAAKMGPLGAKIRGGLESEGRLEASLGPLMDNSFVQSQKQRDATGKHTLGVRYVTKNEEKKQVLYEIKDDVPLDPTPSSTVVNLGTVG